MLRRLRPLRESNGKYADPDGSVSTDALNSARTDMDGRVSRNVSFTSVETSRHAEDLNTGRVLRRMDRLLDFVCPLSACLLLGDRLQRYRYASCRVVLGTFGVPDPRR